MGTTQAAPVLSCDARPAADGRLISDDGTVDLAWQGGEGEFELEQGRDASFSGARLRYEGPDTETVLTGLSDGVYHFRVRGAGEGWSAPLVLHVESMERGTLFLLLGTGAFVAVATIGAILHGSSRTR